MKKLDLALEMVMRWLGNWAYNNPKLFGYKVLAISFMITTGLLFGYICYGSDAYLAFGILSMVTGVGSTIAGYIYCILRFVQTHRIEAKIKDRN